MISILGSIKWLLRYNYDILQTDKLCLQLKFTKRKKKIDACVVPKTLSI